MSPDSRLSRSVVDHRVRELVLGWAVVGVCVVTLAGALASLAPFGARSIMPSRWPPPLPDEVSGFERDLTPARGLLSGVQVAGYASDAPNDRLMNLGYEDQTRRYFLAQYALAPTILSREGTHAWLFVDFRDERSMA